MSNDMTKVTENVFISGPTLKLADGRTVKVPDGLLRPDTRVISVAGELFIRNYCFNMGNTKCWDTVKSSQIIGFD